MPALGPGTWERGASLSPRVPPAPGLPPAGVPRRGPVPLAPAFPCPPAAQPVRVTPSFPRQPGCPRPPSPCAAPRVPPHATRLHHATGQAPCPRPQVLRVISPGPRPCHPAWHSCHCSLVPLVLLAPPRCRPCPIPPGCSLQSCTCPSLTHISVPITAPAVLPFCPTPVADPSCLQAQHVKPFLCQVLHRPLPPIPPFSAPLLPTTSHPSFLCSSLASKAPLPCHILP